jgi:hypothetical protein
LGVSIACFVLAATVRAQNVCAPSGATAAADMASADRRGPEAASPCRSQSHAFAPRFLPDLAFSVYRERSHVVAPGGRYLRPAASPPSRSPAPAARASRASCVADCKAVLPFHQAPIDADGILNRCNVGLAGPAIGLLHGILSQH